MAMTADNFTVLLGDVTLGKTTKVTILRPSSGYSFRFRYAFAGTAGDVAEETMAQCSATKTCVQYDWTVPLCWQELLPAALSGEGVLTVCVDYTGAVPGQTQQNVFTLTKTFTGYVPQETAPTVTMQIAPINDNPVLAAWGLYVRGMSRLHYTLSAAAAGGATVTDSAFSCLGAYGQGLSGCTAPLPLAGTEAPEARVTDSRGRTTRCAAGAITVWDYHAPTLENVNIYRCDSGGTADRGGAYVYIAATASCTGLGGRNSVSLRWRIRPAGGAWGDYAALTSGAGATVGGTLESTAVYEAEVSAVDTVGSVKALRYMLAGNTVSVHLRSGGQGAAFGKLATAAGLSCAWDAAFDGDVAVAGSLTVGGYTLLDSVYPVGALYLSTSDTAPGTLLGGTWQRVKDTLLLASGDIYTGSGSFTGGAAAAMPYLAVYVWQRTA